jgi:hypothetical protein
MNCGRFKNTALRILGAAALSVLILLFIDGPTTYFHAFVVYMLNYMGLSLWAIGEELNERLKALGGWIDGDEEYDDTEV